MDRMKAKEHKLHNVTPPPGSSKPKVAAEDMLKVHDDFRRSDNVKALEAKVTKLEGEVLRWYARPGPNPTYS